MVLDSFFDVQEMLLIIHTIYSIRIMIMDVLDMKCRFDVVRRLNSD